MKPAIVLTVVLACAQSVSAQVSKQPTAKLVTSSTTIEVQRFSGDFTEWTDVLTIHSPQKLTLRWRTTLSTAAAGVWQLSDKPFAASSASPLAANVVASGPLPAVTPGGNAMPFTVDFGAILTSPPKAVPTIYHVRAVPMTAGGQPVGKSFPVARIIYAKAPGGTRFEFDTLKVTAISPTGGTLKGVSANATVGVMDDTNSIQISYSYELNTANAADLRQWLLTGNGGVAPGNLWIWNSVPKGKGTRTHRATIRCETPEQGPIVVTAIDYRLIGGATVLAAGKHHIPGGITFTCPGTPDPGWR